MGGKNSFQNAQHLSSKEKLLPTSGRTGLLTGLKALKSRFPAMDWSIWCVVLSQKRNGSLRLTTMKSQQSENRVLAAPYGSRVR